MRDADDVPGSVAGESAGSCSAPVEGSPVNAAPEHFETRDVVRFIGRFGPDPWRTDA